MKKFFRRIYEPNNSVESIEDLPRDSEDELDAQSQPSQPEEQPEPPQESPEMDELTPPLARTLLTIRINPLGRPFSHLYQSIDSPQYDTYSEESKDHEEATEDRSKESVGSSRENNNGEEVNKRVRRDPEMEPLSIEEQELSENCIIKCFCMKRRK